ncbi:MAG: hypothetical protein LC793_04555, partial [Thermomicrobia bacterium]|nr:hypothetical protein [Thermomicrobia bacterium]MCA1724639.1 hypothetical protein [Thermomicrobia bacterium]
IGMMSLVHPLSIVSVPLADELLWLAWRVGEGAYRINNGDLRPLSREVITPYYDSEEGVMAEIWVRI